MAARRRMTRDVVVDIFTSKEKAAYLVSKYNMSMTAIENIRNYLTYTDITKHLPPRFCTFCHRRWEKMNKLNKKEQK